MKIILPEEYKTVTAKTSDEYKTTNYINIPVDLNNTKQIIKLNYGGEYFKDYPAIGFNITTGNTLWIFENSTIRDKYFEYIQDLIPVTLPVFELIDNGLKKEEKASDERETKEDPFNTFWVARDRDRSIFLFRYKPEKLEGTWESGEVEEIYNFWVELPMDMFPNIKWADEEPTKVKIVEE